MHIDLGYELYDWFDSQLKQRFLSFL